VDSDPEACALYRLNIGTVICDEIGNIATWPEADLVIGGPPCQPFSGAGKKKGATDARDGIPAFFDVLASAQPRAFILENVPGLAQRKPFAKTFAHVIEVACALGYGTNWAILNAADYGIPQVRRRLFVVGIRARNFPDAIFPAPTHGAQTSRECVRVRDAIADLNLSVHTRPFRSMKEGERRHPNFGASSRRLIADQPFPTIKASDTKQSRLIHPWFDRPLAMPELLRAQSFPDNFIVPRKTAAIGNAVPPLMAWHLARAILPILDRMK
jgi:DNA (cytosine-5)-methyltransferase 1